MLRFDDPAFMHELYRSAVRRRDAALADYGDSIERLCGPSYCDDEGLSDIENPEFETIAQLGPAIVWDNPRVRIKTERVGPAQQVAKALDRGCNRNIVVTKFRRTAQRVLTSTLLRYGVFFEELEPQTGYGQIPPPPTADPIIAAPFVPKRPRSRYLSIRRYFQDPTATSPEEIRFRGHEEIADVQDLLERAQANPDEGWNLELLARLQGEDLDVEEVYRPKQTGDAPSRGEIGYVVMYVDGARIEGQPGPEEGFNGVWVTLFVSGANDAGRPQAEELRAPYPAFGPPGGPYTVCGEYYPPDEEVPMSGVQAGAAILTERGAHQAALSRAAARRKSVALVDTSDPAVQLELQDAEDGDVIGVGGLDKAKIAEIEVGGVTEPALAYKAYLDEKTDRLLGADDSSLGSVTGKATATENAIAANATDVRTSGRKRSFEDCIADHLRIKCWMLYYGDTVAFPLPPEQAQGAPDAMPSAQGPAITPPEEWFYGGDVQPGSGFTFEDLELTIDPMSMVRTSPETQAAHASYLSGPFFDVVERLIANPAIPPDKYLAQLGDALNNPAYAELADPKLIRLMQGMSLMAMMTPSVQQDPRLSGDIGAGRTQPMLGAGGGMGGGLGGRPGAFGSSPQRVGASQRFGMAPAGPAGRSGGSKPPSGKKPAKSGKGN